MLHVSLLKDCERAEDETGGLHLDLHDSGESEVGKTLLSLVGDKAQHGPGKDEGSALPPLLTVGVVRARPAVNRNIPTHFGRFKPIHSVQKVRGVAQERGSDARPHSRLR